MMLALVLAASIDVQQICAKYKDAKPPKEAIECGTDPDSMCARELAEDYANGSGVKRDFGVAEHLLCIANAGMAEMETEGMLGHLQRMRSGEEEQPLDFCDYATSGYGSTYCANKEWETLMPQLDERLGRFPENVRRAVNEYVTAETERIGEQSKGGTGYTAITLGAEMATKEHAIEALERWTKTRADAVSAADAKRADDALNAAYHKLRTDYDAAGAEVRAWKTYLRNAQRAWIAYRDAFAAHYAERWRGKADEDVLRREIANALTRDRAAQLAEE